MKNKKVKKKLSKTMVANLIAYHMQDTIDDFGSGGRFDFTKTEKHILSLLKKI